MNTDQSYFILSCVSRTLVRVLIHLSDFQRVRRGNYKPSDD